MRCTFCEWDTQNINTDDAYTELAKHERELHPLQMVNQHDVVKILELHFRYGISIDEIFNTFYIVRQMLSEIK